MNETFKAAITNLGAYNDGNLVYEWLEFPCAEDDFQNAMNSDWWICKENAGTLTNADETMTGWDMLASVREADRWDQPVSSTLPGLEVKDLLATLCDVLGVDWQDAEDWQDAYNRMEDMIESIQ